jgi:hypothetical protein
MDKQTLNAILAVFYETRALRLQSAIANRQKGILGGSTLQEDLERGITKAVDLADLHLAVTIKTDADILEAISLTGAGSLTRI